MYGTYNYIEKQMLCFHLVEKRKCTSNRVVIIHKTQCTKAISIVRVHLVLYKRKTLIR